MHTNKMGYDNIFGLAATTNELFSNVNFNIRDMLTWRFFLECSYLAYLISKKNEYFVATFQVASYYTFWDINYFPVMSFGQVTSDGQKAMLMSPLCIYPK